METRVNKLNGTDRCVKRILMTLVVVIGVLWPYMFSVASTGTQFTLVNRTKYYLHAKINGQSHVYIIPGGSVIVDVSAPTFVSTTVRYSPGQGVSGVADSTIEITESVTSTPAESTCTSNDEGGSTCTNTTEPTTTSSASPGRWEVHSTDLKSE